jgi:hypothetical protein
MIELFKYYVEQDSIEYLRVSWTVKPTTEDIAQYKFVILRSNSPEGPFDLIKETSGVFHYDDFDVNQKSEYRIFYYKIRVLATSGDFEDYGPTYLTEPPDLLALEMIRKKNVALYYGSTPAKQVNVFIRKTWGTYCPECFDQIKKRRSSGNCVTCYNTNYVGGFFSPITVNAFFGPGNKLVEKIGFEVHPDRLYIEFGNYPLLSPGDIIKNKLMNRWRVEGIRSSTRGLYVITQMVQVTEVNPNDIEYNL